MSDDVMISATDDERVWLMCSNKTHEWWTEVLPEPCTPEYALERANAHRATHGAA